MSDDPIIPPIDEMMEVDTAFGRIPLWKAKALMIGRIQHVLNDAVQQSTAPKDEQPPALAADDSSRLLKLLAKRARLREYRDMLNRCDALLERYDLLEQRDRLKQAAAKALHDAEALFTSPEDDDCDRVLN
jgi:hypothetical protein